MSKPLDVSGLRELFASGEVWSAVGVVRARGTASHYEIDGGDVLVDVDLGHDGTPVWCRLGSAAGGASLGVWRIPPVGTEVAVIIPRGNIQCDPMIVATLSSGEVHADLDETTLLVVNDENVKIISTGGDVDIEADGTVNVGGNSYSLPKWDDFATVLKAATQTISALTPASDPATVITLANGIQTAMTTLNTAMANNTNYKSDKAKNG